MEDMDSMFARSSNMMRSMMGADLMGADIMRSMMGGDMMRGMRELMASPASR